MESNRIEAVSEQNLFIRKDMRYSGPFLHIGQITLEQENNYQIISVEIVLLKAPL